MKSIAIFCGSSSGKKGIYEKSAHQVGAYLAKHSIKVIYGGAKIGLMGAVAKGALENQGEVIGIIPDFLKTKEVAHDQLSQMITVKTMHERKQKMDELSDAVIALPGGFGTMEEFFEMLTWGQLGLHTKPIGILNINGFYDPLISLFDSMYEEGFLKLVNREMVLVSDQIEILIKKLRTYQVPEVDKWITRERT